MTSVQTARGVKSTSCAESQTADSSCGLKERQSQHFHSNRHLTAFPRELSNPTLFYSITTYALLSVLARRCRTVNNSRDLPPPPPIYLQATQKCDQNKSMFLILRSMQVAVLLSSPHLPCSLSPVWSSMTTVNFYSIYAESRITLHEIFTGERLIDYLYVHILPNII